MRFQELDGVEPDTMHGKNQNGMGAELSPALDIGAFPTGNISMVPKPL